MPRFDRRRVIGRGRRRMRGKGVLDFLGKANNFLQNSKLISSVAGSLPGIGPVVGGIASLFGYGRRRRLHGRGINLAGGRRMMGGFSKVGF